MNKYLIGADVIGMRKTGGPPPPVPQPPHPPVSVPKSTPVPPKPPASSGGPSNVKQNIVAASNRIATAANKLASRQPRLASKLSNTGSIVANKFTQLKGFDDLIGDGFDVDAFLQGLAKTLAPFINAAADAGDLAYEVASTQDQAQAANLADVAQSGQDLIDNEIQPFLDSANGVLDTGNINALPYPDRLVAQMRTRVRDWKKQANTAIVKSGVTVAPTQPSGQRGGGATGPGDSTYNYSTKMWLDRNGVPVIPQPPAPAGAGKGASGAPPPSDTGSQTAPTATTTQTGPTQAQQAAVVQALANGSTPQQAIAAGMAAGMSLTDAQALVNSLASQFPQQQQQPQGGGGGYGGGGGGGGYDGGGGGGSTASDEPNVDWGDGGGGADEGATAAAEMQTEQQASDDSGLTPDVVGQIMRELEMVGMFDIQTKQHEMNVLTQVPISVAPILLRYGQDAIDNARAIALQKGLPGGTARDKVWWTLSWFRSDIDKAMTMSPKPEIYASGDALKKAVVSAFIESNAADEGAAWVDAQWSNMWNEIKTELAKLPAKIRQAAANAVETVTGVPIWLWGVGGALVVGALGLLVYKMAGPIAGVAARRYL